MGRVRCRHRLRRRPAVGRPHEFRRPLVRLHLRQGPADATVARPHYRPDRGCGRPGRLQPHLAGPGTAHPARQGHFQHLHQSRPAGDRGGRPHGADGRQGAGRGRLGQPSQHAAAGRAAHRHRGRASVVPRPLLPRMRLGTAKARWGGARRLARSRHSRRGFAHHALPGARQRAAGLRHRKAQRDEIDAFGEALENILR